MAEENATAGDSSRAESSSSTRWGIVIVAVVFVVVILVVVFANPSSTPEQGTRSDRHTITDPAGTDEDNPLAIGTWVTYDNGVRVLAAEPRSIAAADAAKIGSYDGLLEVELTIVNGSDEELTDRIYFTMVSGNVDGESVFGLSDDKPDAVAAGATCSFRTVFGVHDPNAFVLHVHLGSGYDSFAVEWSTSAAGEATAEPSAALGES